MKYLIEIISRNRFGDGALGRAIVESTDLAAARSKAIPLLEIWAKTGATHARVLRTDGQVVGEVQLERDNERRNPSPTGRRHSPTFSQIQDLRRSHSIKMARRTDLRPCDCKIASYILCAAALIHKKSRW
jgi:hypothetical protein